MLEVLHNDKHSTLSFIHSTDNDILYIVDDTLRIYNAICYTHCDPSDSELLRAWEKAVKEYYAVYNEDVKDWKETRLEQSIKDFADFLTGDEQ